MQKILSLIITAAILYTIIQLQNNNKTPEKVNTTDSTTRNNIETTNNDTLTPQSGNIIEKTLSNVLINILKTEDGRIFFENILQPMNKPLAGSDQSYKINNVNFIQSMFKINTFGEGKVGPASCGHIVKVHYQIFDTNNIVIDEQTKTYTLGSRSIIPGLDNVIVGMMVGQTRQAIIPPKYAYFNMKDKATNININPESYYKINVVLQELLPQNFVKNEEVKIFDDEIAYKIPLLCGDRAVFDARITKLSNGSMLYNSSLSGAKINMIIGDLNYPLIFSHALYGKIPIGTRTVIAKGRTFQALGNRISKIFPKEQLPTDEYFMLELMNFEIAE